MDVDIGVEQKRLLNMTVLIFSKVLKRRQYEFWFYPSIDCTKCCYIDGNNWRWRLGKCNWLIQCTRQPEVVFPSIYNAGGLSINPAAIQHCRLFWQWLESASRFSGPGSCSLYWPKERSPSVHILHWVRNWEGAWADLQEVGIGCSSFSKVVSASREQWTKMSWCRWSVMVRHSNAATRAPALANHNGQWGFPLARRGCVRSVSNCQRKHDPGPTHTH
jgi:hypothetical protein